MQLKGCHLLRRPNSLEEDRCVNLKRLEHERGAQRISSQSAGLKELNPRGSLIGEQPWQSCLKIHQRQGQVVPSDEEVHWLGRGRDESNNF